jgi:hypothetical protein
MLRRLAAERLHDASTLERLGKNSLSISWARQTGHIP